MGDRIRMNAIGNPRLYLRSLATRQSQTEIPEVLADAITAVKAAGFDLIIAETAGIGQGDSSIADLVDMSMYVMTSEFGAASQLEKIDMLDFADIVVVNKFEKRGGEDAVAGGGPGDPALEQDPAVQGPEGRDHGPRRDEPGAPAPAGRAMDNTAARRLIAT